MKLRKLLKGINIIDINADYDTEISTITSDSRKAIKDSLFVAVQGENRDGNLFIEEAIKNGASVVISDKGIPVTKEWIFVQNSRNALSILWSNYYENPTEKMKVIAITGTNGKTSTAYFVYNILTNAGKSSGLISTVECLINGEKRSFGGGGEVSDICSAMTTPDPEILYKIFAQMRNEGCEYIVMEASSHSLWQNKLDGTHITVGIFTNLSSEHLDFHKSMENYFMSKFRLFEKCETAIVNADDLYGVKIADKCASPVFSCSARKSANYYAERISVNENGCEYILVSKNSTLRINSVLCGDYNVYNSMLAAACCECMGIDTVSICEGIRFTDRINGRLEKYKNYNIYIDYAHTPCAMEKVIKSIRNFAPDKNITVLFGCGGDRDKSKRADMGRISTSLSDNTIITSDNSRTEEPILIIKDILKGVIPNKPYTVIPNRKEAILYAVKKMGKNDILLLLGKGHENYEIDKSGKHPFDERKIIAEALDKR